MWIVPYGIVVKWDGGGDRQCGLWPGVWDSVGCTILYCDRGGDGQCRLWPGVWDSVGCTILYCDRGGDGQCRLWPGVWDSVGCTIRTVTEGGMDSADCGLVCDSVAWCVGHTILYCLSCGKMGRRGGTITTTILCVGKNQISAWETIISYAGCFFYINHPTEGCAQQQVKSKPNATVEWISLARQSHHVQLPAKVLTQQFCSALPVTCENRIIILTYHSFAVYIGNTKLIYLDIPWPIEPANFQ